jgi:hypothetical protein
MSYLKKKSFNLKLIIIGGLVLSSCQKFEDGKNFRLRSVKQILCKNTWKLGASNFDGDSFDYETINLFDLKFNKDGTCTYKVSIFRNELDQDNPNYKPYQGFYQYAEDTLITSIWKFPNQDKSTIVITMDGYDERFYITRLSRYALDINNKVDGTDLSEFMYFSRD